MQNVIFHAQTVSPCMTLILFILGFSGWCNTDGGGGGHPLFLKLKGSNFLDNDFGIKILLQEKSGSNRY